jgi:hypothetical protein
MFTTPVLNSHLWEMMGQLLDLLSLGQLQHLLALLSLSPQQQQQHQQWDHLAVTLAAVLQG